MRLNRRGAAHQALVVWRNGWLLLAEIDQSTAGCFRRLTPLGLFGCWSSRCVTATSTRCDSIWRVGLAVCSFLPARFACYVLHRLITRLSGLKDRIKGMILHTPSPLSFSSDSITDSCRWGSSWKRLEGSDCRVLKVDHIRCP